MKKYFPYLTSVLLLACFPDHTLAYLAWIALVPLLASVREAPNGNSAFFSGFGSGLLFFLISISWLNHVSTFGWVFLAVLEAAFMGLFALLAYIAFHRHYFWVRILCVACAWTAVEWLRAEIPVFGFGWNLLGYSQTRYPYILQTANVIGAYGLGFVICLANAALLEFFSCFKKSSRNPHNPRGNMKRAAVIMTGFLAVAGLVYSHGRYHWNHEEDDSRSLRISLIQGNIPQDIKWDPVAKFKILEKYLKLTEIANFNEPDIIIWPEAAYPGYLNRDKAAEQLTTLIRQIGVPALIGTPYLDEDLRSFNSAVLLDAEGTAVDRYDKIFLVPFGEYIPLKPLFSFLEPLARSLGVGDFKKGKEFRVFTAGPEGVPFSVMICFEDIFPAFARKFVEGGARYLAVITNDAWFGKTAAPFQHLQASIFRAVENGVPLVRAANTGVSAYISYKGEIIDLLVNKDQEALFQTLHQTKAVSLIEKQTWYRKGGWLFPYFAVTAYVMIMTLFRRKNPVK